MRRRICWDTMLFIHFFEDNGAVRQEVASALRESILRDDELFASCLTLGELYAGAARLADARSERTLRAKMAELDLKLLPFDTNALEIFSALRAGQNVKSPDAINLACAGAAGVDLFLTYDKALLKLQVPGIKFIATPSAGLV